MAPPGPYVGSEKCLCVIFMLIAAAAVWQQGEAATIRRMLGIKFLSFSIANGQLPDGSCCDGANDVTNGGCLPDTCDTGFTMCLRHHSNATQCDPKRIERSTILNNNTITEFGVRFGGPFKNGSTSLLAVAVPTMEDIRIELDVLEMDEANPATPGIPMANFSMVLDYTNLYTPTPAWDTYRLHDGAVSLIVNVTSYCAKYFFGSACDVNCRPADSSRLGHYTCANNGSKLCIQGWTGPDCKQMIDYCQSSPCFVNATCIAVLNGFNCNCSSGYTGRLCSNLASSNVAVPSEDKDNVFLIVGPVLGVLLLLALCIAGYFVWRRTTKNKNNKVGPPEEELQSRDGGDEKAEKEGETTIYLPAEEKPEPPPMPASLLDW